MYDHFVGEVIEAHGTQVVLRAGGIGYELKTPIGTSAALKRGDTAQLFTILHVVDGSPSLIGFATKNERELARRILAVSGVGPAIALAILSTYDPNTFGGLILAGDSASLKKVKGIGGKTAERLCLELRDRIAQLDLGELVLPTSTTASLPQEAEDAILALCTLGYNESDARKRVEKITQAEPDAATEKLIKAVLRG